MTETPKISIITVNLNDVEGLERTFNSIFKQSWEGYELIVIDGGSSDGSKELIEKNKDRIKYWVSEPDQGVYNAMNKGIRMASGEYLIFLNSGDCLNNKKVLGLVARSLTADFDIFYGDVQLYDNRNLKKKSLIQYPEELTFSFFCRGTLIHQVVFIKKTLFEEIFFYNEDLRFVSDWEFLICAICKYNVSYKKLDFIIADYDINGISSDPENEKLLYKEREEVLNRKFPLIMKDYEELVDSKNKLALPVVKSVLELERYITARKIHRFVLRFLLNASKLKNKAFRKKNG